MRAWLAAAAVLLLAAGCKTASFLDRIDYPIAVEEVIAPDEIVAGQPLSVGFTGFIGSTTCHHFHEFVTRASPSQLEIALVGRYEARSGVACQPVAKHLTEEHTYRHTGAMTDPFTIIVYQPDGTQVEHEVRVR